MALFQDQFPWTNVHELNLDWILKHFKEFIAVLGDLEEWRAEHEAEYQELKQLYEDILAGNFPPAMLNALHTWVVNNTVDIIGAAIKTVLFELTPEGYFIAYIPDSWSDLIFGTSGLDTFPAGVDYGHLTLTY